MREILIVEDSDEDYEAILRAFRNLAIKNEVRRCLGWDECYAYLSQAQQGEAAFPGLILLDLNLPGLDGRGILQRLKADLNLRVIPVSIMTTSINPSDVRFCYDNGANSMFQKPLNFAALQQKLARTLDYWFTTVVLP